MTIWYMPDDRCFKNFRKEIFEKNRSENLKNIGNSFEVFYDTFTNTLDCSAPLKKKKIALILTNLWRKNYVRKLWRDPRLDSKYNKNRTYENWSNYKKQRNICTNILKDTKIGYFNNIDIKNITDNKEVLDLCETFFYR